MTMDVNATLTKQLDQGVGSFPASLSKFHQMADGVGDNQSDLLFAETRTLAANTSEDLDLSGSLLDAFGTTLNFVKIKAVLVSASNANVGNIEVGGAAANGFIDWVGAFADNIIIKPNGSFMVMNPTNGYDVAAGTADKLKINNTATGATGDYSIALIGTSA